MATKRAHSISRGLSDILGIFSAAVSAAGDVERHRKPNSSAMRRLGIRADAFDRTSL
ncbi:hypothetical protein [Methylobrevis pamukkalensis]|nr:hypothetical protein [Methylobrevis pamukkalensis]